MKVIKCLFLVLAWVLILPLKGESNSSIILGIERMEEYLPLLKDKRVGVVGNQTSQLYKTHLVDTLLANGIKLVKIFSPEHGFRGTADAGELVESQRDSKTNLPVVSLYGDNKKPTDKQLEDVDILLFDIQDVGVRFYTYISTLHYVMEAAAELNIPLIVLDRPNPNGHYIDGPILEKKYQSFVGMHPVPIVHGMTIGEYAQMINGEGWLGEKIKCDLKIIACENYNHQMDYKVPIAPSPNLPNMRSIYLYPYLCLFEGTVISVGRGTDKPFQQIGNPELQAYRYSFIPKSMEGAKSPKHMDERCFGIDFTAITENFFKSKGRLDLSYLIELYENYPEKSEFFTNFFNLLAGNNSLQNDIKAKKTEVQIRKKWEKGLEDFKNIRNNYLLYP